MQWLHSIKNDSERSFGVIILCIGKLSSKNCKKHQIFKILYIYIEKNTSDSVLNFQVLKPKISQKFKKKMV